MRPLDSRGNFQRLLSKLVDSHLRGDLCATPAVSRIQEPERGTSGNCWASAPLQRSAEFEKFACPSYLRSSAVPFQHGPPPYCFCLPRRGRHRRRVMVHDHPVVALFYECEAITRWQCLG